MSRIISHLEKEGFVSIEYRGRTHYISFAQTQHARALHDLITSIPGIPYERYLYGRRIVVLWTLLYEPKSVREIAWTLGMGEEVVRRHLRSLKKWALLWYEQGRYHVAKRAPSPWEFLDAYRKYTPVAGKVLWKLGDEILFQTTVEMDAVPSGFMGYRDHGVQYGGDIHYTWFLPKRKLSMEEIAVQSLVELEDPRDLAMVIVFVLKHRLAYKKIEKLAVKYDCRERLRDLFVVMRSGERRIETEHLPPITQREIDETLQLYKVKKYVPKTRA